VAAFLYGQVLLWRVGLIFPEAPVGDFVATHAEWVSPRSRQDVTRKRWRAERPTMGWGGKRIWVMEEAGMGWGGGNGAAVARGRRRYGVRRKE